MALCGNMNHIPTLNYIFKHICIFKFNPHKAHFICKAFSEKQWESVYYKKPKQIYSTNKTCDQTLSLKEYFTAY